jgi:hypothetical protein
LLIAELETRVEQLSASEVDMKNLFYREKEARQVLEYDYKQLAYECDKHMELGIASDRDLVNCYKSLQKLNKDCEKLRAQLKELEEATLPIARLLVPHPSGPKIAPLVDQLREAPSHLATYVKHLAKSIPNQILAYMKSYFPKAPIDVVAGGLAPTAQTSSTWSCWSRWRQLLSRSPRRLTSSSPVGLACSSSCR